MMKRQIKDTDYLSLNCDQFSINGVDIQRNMAKEKSVASADLKFSLFSQLICFKEVKMG